MSAPLHLLIVAALLGIIVPSGVNTLTLSAGHELLVVPVRLLGLALVPVVIARVAYRSGYDRAAAKQAKKGEGG